MVVALIASACSSRYGTYLVVKGSPSLTYDRVEFYFGAPLDADGGPTTPGHPVKATVTTNAVVAKRLFAETDVEALPRPTDHFNYYLPDTEANRGLGDLVVAIAYRGQTPVGIGELRDFKIVGDEVWLYDIPLAPYDATATELWGRPTGDCLRWADPGTGETVFVVRHDDIDCDDFADGGVDCDPRRYCDGGGGLECAGTVGCLQGGTTCSVGGCVNSDAGTRSCTASLCLPDVLCDHCIDGDPIVDELRCAIIDPQHGNDYPLTVKTNLLPCSDPFEFQLVLPGGVTCDDPRVVAAFPLPAGTPDRFTFTAEAGNGPCNITVKSDGVLPAAKFPLYHLMISLPSMNALRSTLIIGLAPEPGACGAPQTITADGKIAVCDQ